MEQATAGKKFWGIYENVKHLVDQANILCKVKESNSLVRYSSRKKTVLKFEISVPTIVPASGFIVFSNKMLQNMESEVGVRSKCLSTTSRVF